MRPAGGQIPDAISRFPERSRERRSLRGPAFVLLRALLVLAFAPACLAQTPTPRPDSTIPDSTIPDAPTPQAESAGVPPRPNPCPKPIYRGQLAARPVSKSADNFSGLGVYPANEPCTPRRANWYQRFTDGPQNKPLTPRDKGWLAVRNVVDPFNVITVTGEAGITVASDSHSDYGPGMPGYGRYVGVAFTEDITGEFVGTFLIPTLAHQDPHYYRLPNSHVPRRIAHAITQIFWTQSDSGHGMPNYANLVGFAIDDGVANLYVPGRQTSVEASSKRYVIGLATAPIGNFINEFLPDLASHVHVEIVVLQRIINQVARSGTGNSNTQ